ncbi:MAG: LysE family translocator [Pseudohongiella sp.]|nr:LysE family translocator [Pseudohongiella sp.]MDP3516202.1 LysE family translocator [Pseudohongiella sp.]
MSTEFVISVFLFALSSAITPGPNNVMLMSSGVNYGVRRSLPLVMGVIIGFPAMFLAIGLGLGTVFQRYPIIHDVITVVGIAYLLYLAWKIAGSGKPVHADPKARPLTFVQAALFQWVNPKAWIMAMGAIAAFTTTGPDINQQVFNITGIFMTASVPSAWTWLLFGVGLQRLLADDVWRQRFNWLMAALLVVSMVPVVLDLVRG